MTLLMPDRPLLAGGADNVAAINVSLCCIRLADLPRFGRERLLLRARTFLWALKRHLH